MARFITVLMMTDPEPLVLWQLLKPFIKLKSWTWPKRSILFLHVTGEEKGLFGSSYYSDNPIFPLANTVADLNIDMIGRVDPLHKDNPNFVYVVGSEMLSSQLKEAVEKANKATHNLYLDYKYDDPKDPDRIYYRSDHYNFAKHNIPIAFFFDGIHEDYHKPTDTPDKIDYPLLMKRTQLVFAIAWDLANRPDRIVVDKNNVNIKHLFYEVAGGFISPVFISGKCGKIIRIKSYGTP